MKEKARLIFRVFDLLATIETEENQPTVNLIKGYLYGLMEEEEPQ